MEKGVEVELFQFEKSKKAYMINLFFGTSSIKYLLFPIVIGFLLLFEFIIFKNSSDTCSWRFTLLGFLGLGAFCWICQICIGLFMWKYKKYIVVTNQGIWLSHYGYYYDGFIFDGKPRKSGLCWSIYAREELNSVQMFTDRIARGLKLKNFKIDRWDGIEKVYYLKKDDVEKVVLCSKKYIKKKKKEEEEEYVPRKLDFFKKVENLFKKEMDEEIEDKEKRR